MVCEIASRLEDAEARRENKLQRILRTQVPRRLPGQFPEDSGHLGRPSSGGVVPLSPARAVRLHLIALLIHELVTVVSGQNKPRTPASDSLRTARTRFPSTVAMTCRAIWFCPDSPNSSISPDRTKINGALATFVCSLRGCQFEDSLQLQFHQIRNPGLPILLSRGPIGQETAVDPDAEFSLLLRDGEAA